MADHKLKGEENVEHFLNNLYSDICTEVRWSDELPDIIGATREMVNKIVTEFKLSNKKELEKEGVVNIEVSDAGSIAEGTKICNPDEFDFVISFTYSSGILKTLPPSNENNILVGNTKVEPGDPRYCEIRKGCNNEEFLPIRFMIRNFLRLERALLKVSKEGPIRRRGNSLHLVVSDDSGNTYYGMQGPAFHLHNNVRWFSRKLGKCLPMSIDIVPAVVIYDKSFVDKLPGFIQDCSCKKHFLHKPGHFFLVPIKSKVISSAAWLRFAEEGDSDYWNDKEKFIYRNFMVSLSEYESDVMKMWKCEKSIYHNWFICYKLMKSFGNLDHSCGPIVKFDHQGKMSMKFHKPHRFPERNESFTSYTWKTLVFVMARQETSKLSLKQCFDRLTAMFNKEKLDQSKDFAVQSFWWPSKISETIHLYKKDSHYTQFVHRMMQLKVILNEIIYSPSYKYLDYRKKIKNIFPELAPYLPENGNGKESASDCKSKL